jgi:FG-GAP-like repeat
MKRLRQSELSGSRAVGVALGFLCMVLGFAACGFAASTGPQSWPVSSTAVTSQFVIADFDGDKRPDLAIVQARQGNSSDTRYWIAFQRSGGARQTLGISAPNGGLRITARDVNGDDFLDLIVTAAWTGQPVAVLLNDGHGDFQASSPSGFPGAFSTSEKFWTPATDDVRGAAAVLLSRYSTGNCTEASTFLPPRNVNGLLALWNSRGWLSSVVVSFLGRAPPSSVLHT